MFNLIFNSILIVMKSNRLRIVLCLVAVFAFIKCSDFPVDEDGLLITDRAECYVSNFDLVDTSHETVRTSAAVIDTTECTINVEVRYGTDLRHLWPRFTLCEDAKLEPKVSGYTDFSDLQNPLRYTVVAGNRSVRKTYTVYVAVQEP